MPPGFSRATGTIASALAILAVVVSGSLWVARAENAHESEEIARKVADSQHDEKDNALAEALEKIATTQAIIAKTADRLATIEEIRARAETTDPESR